MSTTACYWVNLVASHTDAEVWWTYRKICPHIVFCIKPISIFSANFENVISHRYISEYSGFFTVIIEVYGNSTFRLAQNLTGGTSVFICQVCAHLNVSYISCCFFNKPWCVRGNINWFRSRVDAGSNTSTVTLRVVEGDEKGSLESEPVKYGHESYGTRTRKWLRWREPVAIANGRPVLSLERVPQINKPATVRQ
jgi:hypothetical protein